MTLLERKVCGALSVGNAKAFAARVVHDDGVVTFALTGDPQHLVRLVSSW